jgi:hypothetical protein
MAEAPPNGLFWSVIDRAADRAEIDGDRLVVDLDPCGPAGASSVELPGGDVIQVDHLDPARLVGAEVDGEDAGGSPLLVALFGGDGAMLVAERARSGRSSRRPRTSSRRGENGPSISRRRALPLDLAAQRAGRLVVLTDLMTDPAVDPLARVAAAAEFVESLDTTPGGDLFAPIVPRLIDGAVDAASEVDDDTVASLDPVLAGRLSAELGALLAAGFSVTGSAPAAMTPVVRLVEMLETHRRHGDAQILSAMSPAEQPLDGLADAFADEWAMDDLQLADGPVRGSTPPMSFVRRSPSVLEVTAPRVHESQWVRVLRTDGLVALATAPLRLDGLMLHAELVVPPDTHSRDLGLQLVGPDELDAMSGAPADLVRRAVRAGRAATSAERSGDRSAAFERWRRCAAWWGRVGDDRRARQAMERGTSRGGRVMVDPVLADELDPFGTDVLIESGDG